MFAVLDLEKEQLDIYRPLLCMGSKIEEIYITHPEGFVVLEIEHLVCSLIKCIYGLN
jgi:hypothetical protein